MIEFDPYVPATWMDHGLLVVTAQEEKKKRVAKRARSFKIVAAASAFAIGMALTDLSFSVTGYAVGDRVQFSEPIAPIAGMPDDVAPGYWPKLVRLVRETPSLPADDTSGDPAPLA